MTVQSQQRTDWISAWRVDYMLLAIVGALLVVGLIMVWSVTFPPNVGDLPEPQSDFVRQAAFAVVGIVSLIILTRVDYRVWGRLAVPLMVVTVLLLVAVLFTEPVNGARRWLFVNSIQPSEIAKFTMVVYMAKWLSSKGEKLRHITYGLLPFGIIVGIVCGLIALEPNLSTAIIIGLCALAMFFIAGVDLIQLALVMIFGGVTAAIVIVNTPYQLSRFLAFWQQDPVKVMDGVGYHIHEAVIALGSGGLLGHGLGSGYYKFGYIPAPQTDSIFALLGEEMGLVGTWIVLALYLALVYRGFRIAAKTTDPFGQVLAAGLTFWLIFQAFVNIAVVTATIPFTGVPLPFISFGGSALIAALAAVGVLLNISHSESAPKVGNPLQGKADATLNFGWRDGGTRVSRADRRRRNPEASSRNARPRSR
jgi:cell division protein FtsW